MKNNVKIPLSRNSLDREDIDGLIKWLNTDPLPKLSQGANVELFEKRWSEKLGVKYSVFVNSGSSANLLAIYSLLLKYNIKKCVVPAVSWITDISPLIQFGIKPILCDIERDTLAIDPEKFEEICIKEKPDVLLLVHVLGIAGKIDKIEKICQKYNVILVEDSCEAMETVFKGKKVGTFGLMSTFSLFYAHIICSVEGGIIATNDKELYNILLSLRAHGWMRSWDSATREKYKRNYNIDDFSESYSFFFPGFNVRNTEINAFIALTQLDKIDTFCQKRRELLQIYDKLIKNCYWKLKIKETDVGFAYPIIHPKRGELVKVLQEKGVEVRPLIAGSMGLQSFWIERYGEQHFKFSDIVSKYGCYVPIHHNLYNIEIKYICNIINKVINE